MVEPTAIPYHLEWPDEIDLDSSLAIMLGRPNFWCAPIAHLYKRVGLEIPPKAEVEQAFVIHRMVRFLCTHGPTGWRAAMEQEMDELYEHLEHGGTNA